MTVTGALPESSAGHPDGPDAKYARSQTRAAWAQMTTALVAVGVAAFVAWQGFVTVRSNTQASLRQSEDSQLSTAITSLGSSATAERVAGLLLLARNASGRFTLYAQSGEPRADVYDDYTTALQILSGYLRSGSADFLTPGQFPVPFGLGYGAPPLADYPIDLTYAADQVRKLVNPQMAASVAGLGAGNQTAIDLSNDELYGLSWTGVDFSWLIAYMPGIDLRGADLATSQWGTRTDLSHAYLQCANLGAANFQGADLMGADLRGAYVQGANFRGAHVRPLVPGTLVYGDAHWAHLPRGITVLPASQWNQTACLQDSHYWDVPRPGPTS